MALSSRNSAPRKSTTDPVFHDAPAVSPPVPWRSSASRVRWVALLCSLLACVYYLAFQSHRLGFDALDYAYGVKRGHNLFHPHHLLYNAVGRALYVAVSALHPVDALSLLASQNAVVTAASVGLMCLLLFRVTQRLSVSIGLCLLFAGLRGVTAMATSVEVYPATTLFELCAISLWLLRPVPSLGTLAAMGICCGLCALFHQTGIFFVLAMAYGLWTQDRRPSRVLCFLAAAFAVCGGAYLYVGMVVEKRPLGGLWTWVTAYAHSDEYRLGMWGHGLRLQSLPSAAQGLFQVITAPYYLENLSRQFRPSVWDVVLSLSLLASLGLWLSLLVTALRRPKGIASHGAEDLANTHLAAQTLRPLLMLWIGLHAAFTLWWEPGNFEFWLLAAPPTVLLCGSLCRRPPNAKKQWQMSVALGLLFFGNFGLCTLPSHRGVDNPNAEIYRILSTQTVDSEDIYVGDFATLQLYFLYYADKRVPLHSLRFEGYSRPSQKAEVIDSYRARIDNIRRQHRVFFLEHERFDQYDAFDREDVERLYAPMLVGATEIGSYQKGADTYRILRLATLP